MSGSGRYVTFWSEATNLSRNNQGVSVPTSYLRDTYRHRTFLLQPRAHLRRERHPGLGETSDLVPGDTNGKPDAFVADLKTGAISLVDRTAAGTPGDAGAEVETIDVFGRNITFGSRSRDLDPAATNGVRQVYMRDMLTGKTIVDSRRAGAHGALGDRDAGASTIFYAGRYVAFSTGARNLPHRPCSGSNIVVRDMRRLTTRLIRRPKRLSRRCTMTAPDDEFSGRRPSHTA